MDLIQNGSKVPLNDFANVHCHCGQVIDQLATLVETLDKGLFLKRGGGFVKEGPEKFLISDDLQVMPGFYLPTNMLLKNLKIVNANELVSQECEYRTSQGNNLIFYVLCISCYSGTRKIDFVPL